jgi:hypothetical protein
VFFLLGLACFPRRKLATQIEFLKLVCLKMPTALNDLLKVTSRSFYLTLRVLPAAVRPQIGLVKRMALRGGAG